MQQPKRNPLYIVCVLVITSDINKTAKHMPSRFNYGVVVDVGSLSSAPNTARYSSGSFAFSSS